MRAVRDGARGNAYTCAYPRGYPDGAHRDPYPTRNACPPSNLYPNPNAYACSRRDADSDVRPDGSRRAYANLSAHAHRHACADF